MVSLFVVQKGKHSQHYQENWKNMEFNTKMDGTKLLQSKKSLKKCRRDKKMSYNFYIVQNQTNINYIFPKYTYI